MKILLIFAIALSFNANAIDSLLKEAAKHEKEAVKKASKGKAAAILTLKSGEAIQCVWLARAKDEFRYQRVSDGKLVSTPYSSVDQVEGAVLDETPKSEVVVHSMYCDGRSCKPTTKTILIDAWPQK